MFGAYMIRHIIALILIIYHHEEINAFYIDVIIKHILYLNTKIILVK
jgi:hypothetical protein